MSQVEAIALERACIHAISECYTIEEASSFLAALSALKVGQQVITLEQMVDLSGHEQARTRRTLGQFCQTLAIRESLSLVSRDPGASNSWWFAVILDQMSKATFDPDVIKILSQGWADPAAWQMAARSGVMLMTEHEVCELVGGVNSPGPLRGEVLRLIHERWRSDIPTTVRMCLRHMSKPFTSEELLLMSSLGV